MQSNWVSHTRLVAKAKWQHGTITLDDSLAVSYRVKHTLTVKPSTLIPRSLLHTKENICPHKDLSTNIYSSFIHSHFKLKTTQTFSTNKLCISTMASCSAIQKTELVIQVTTWMTLKALCKVKEARFKRYMLCDSLNLTFWKKQSY